MAFQDTQNPGIGGLDELTDAEALLVQTLASLSYAQGDILYYDGTGLNRLPAGTSGYYLKTQGVGANPVWAAVSGSGTVTSVSVTTANGVSGSVATATTTPAITLTLGAITPSSVNSVVLSGASTPTLSVTGTSSISGANTGDNATNSQYSGLASSKADVGQTFYIGTTQIAINRASAALTLAGITLTTPDIGTPTAGVLTNATGLPISGLVASTSTALGVGSIELGHATDTTISRTGAGVIAVEGINVPTISSTSTLTNKRINKRTGTTTSSATPTINTDNVDFYSITAQSQDITSFTTNLSGTPVEGQTLWIAITGTAARAITWGTSFESSTISLPTTTVTTARLDVGFVWNTVTSKWRCVATC